ncbi:LysR family hydrogen peroxide-inducible transcriptional activator [Methylosinus sp. sav-2]|uniref:hydrogen peroxide-inducible genes activator n=1 Tax=unclassified Methylosinus TaxID=2624500 RepID=UPI000463E65C|nr:MULTISPECIES: hydrogen peroxide-inducible genes activator [unclassified Methylosinus]TDX65242.1 LysR family hydrogen peroxide-inducible transcriptional activator [Methylosinus sp. sav-2]
MITTKQLRYFEALARTEHFGKAADLCAVTQPALSMQIKELEVELGTQLVERRGKLVILTAAGGEIAKVARRILADISELETMADQNFCPLRLGVIPTVAPYILPTLFDALGGGAADLRPLHIREAQTATLLAELDDGLLDLVMLATPVDPELDSMPLFEDRFFLVAPLNGLPEEAGSVSAETLKAQRLLLLEDGHCLRDQALSYCESRNVLNIDTFGMTNLTTLVQMVSAGMGCTLLPEMSLPIETARGSVRVLRIEQPEPRRIIGLVWRRSSRRGDEFRALGRMIVASRNAALEGAAALSET